MNKSTFLVIYILALPLTYVLPYFGSNSFMAAFSTGGITLLGTAVHLACFGAMGFAALMRGDAVKKGWLVALPAGALFFDFMPLLSAIPLIPTAFHVAALAVGAEEPGTGPRP